MSVLRNNLKKRWLVGLASLLSVAGLTAQAQTTPNVAVTILGTGTASLIGGDITDPENDGLDESGMALDPSWNWKGITASHEEDFEGAESAFNIFDNKVGGGANKWCCDDPTVDAPVWVAVEFNRPVTLTHFTITSGNDSPDRDPTDWAIQGSNDGTTYTTIYRFTGTPTPWTARDQVVKFTLPAAAPEYTFLRYIAWETPGTLHQLNEIEFFEAPVKRGLVAYWNFDGNNFEDAVGVFDGTENGSEPIAFVDGKSGFGRAIRLNGEDQFVEITGGEPDDLGFAGGNVSISGWFKVAAFDTDWQALIAKGEGTNWRVARRAAEGGISYAGGLTDTPAGKDVNDGQWHHFVAISDAAGTEFGGALYIDGVRDAITTGPAVLTATGLRVRIGDNPGAPSREFEGDLDDIGIWNRILTQDEITALSKMSLGDVLNAVVPDADRDGMPDDWEIRYGFNPNDPSDAALDFDGDGATNLQEYNAGTDPSDVTKPTIASIAGSPTFNAVTITFSEDVDPATATVVGNYTISPSLAVTAATYSRRVVTLTTAAQTPGATAYTVTVTGVRDMSKNEVASPTTATFYTYVLAKAGILKLSYWTGITGTPVDNLYADERYPASPTGVAAIYSFDSRGFFPTDALENYGAVIEGLITPTQAGDYRFFIRSDDASQFYLSSDATEANLELIAEQPGCCNAFMEPDSQMTSEPRTLVAGRSYYARLIYKEGGGGDYGQVAWRREGDDTPAASLLPIPTTFLSSATDVPVPAEGVYQTQSPAPNAINVAPNAAVRIVHIDGKTPWTAETVSMKFDGVTVTPTFVKDGAQATVTYQPSGLLPSMSTHTIELTYPNPVGQPATTQWSYEVAQYRGPVVDKVAGHPGLIFGTAAQTADRGGRSGNAGDFGMDFPNGGGSINVIDASFVNTAMAADKFSVALWQKATVRAGSAFWFNSPSSTGTTRGFQAHIPWSDSTIYFDSAGCCDADLTRISLNIADFPGYSGEPTWWETWHHFAFVKNGEAKEIYIDGQLFHSGLGNPLPSDITNLIIGGGPTINDNRMAGTMDDFAVYSTALTPAQITSLFNGTAPGAVTGNPGLIAHWDFNDAPVADVQILVTRSGANVTVTSVPAALPAGWVLQTAESINGPWTTQAGATTPLTVPIGTGNTFLRATRP